MASVILSSKRNNVQCGWNEVLTYQRDSSFFFFRKERITFVVNSICILPQTEAESRLCLLIVIFS